MHRAKVFRNSGSSASSLNSMRRQSSPVNTNRSLFTAIILAPAPAGSAPVPRQSSRTTDGSPRRWFPPRGDRPCRYPGRPGSRTDHTPPWRTGPAKARKFSPCLRSASMIPRISPFFETIPHLLMGIPGHSARNLSFLSCRQTTHVLYWTHDPETEEKISRSELKTPRKEVMSCLLSNASPACSWPW